jgi:signal transduction histidine kinase
VSRLHRIVGGRGTLQRRYAVAAVVFAVLVTAIVLLFGQLISRSLSRRYLEDQIVTGREEARRIADELGEDFVQELQVVEKRREWLLRTLEGQPEKHVWETIEVLDADGNVVASTVFQSREELPGDPDSEIELGDGLGDDRVLETGDSYTITAPLGDVGQLVLRMDRGRLAARVARLRSELLLQTVAIAALTLATLVGGFVFVWFQIQRTRRAEAKRREAEELASLGSLAANLAHEIRNPLNSINLNLELLEEDLGGGDGEAASSLATTRRELGRLASLVTDFLVYARPTPPVREPVRVDRLVREVREFLHAEARTMGVHLRVATDVPGVTVLADEAQLRQVLLNLVLNAVQAVEGLDPDRRVVELGGAGDHGSVVLSVRDRGPGIPPDDLERVRAAFYTRRRGGTGLGLAVAERFVTAHGGRIELENLAAGGFEARVVLPLGDGDGTMNARGARDSGRDGGT